MHLVRAAIDDVGDVALVLGADVRLDLVAPLSGSRAVLELELGSSFHGGAVWRRRGADGGALRAGDVLSLADVELCRVAADVDPASAALPLRFGRHVHLSALDETVRAAWILPPGPAGRVLLEPPGLGGTLELEFDPEAPALVVHASRDLSLDGGTPAPGHRVELPLARRVHIGGARTGGGPPFGLVLR